MQVYEGLLTGSICLDGGIPCRYWQAVVVELYTKDGNTQGFLSRTELRKEIDGESTPQADFPSEWNAHLERFGACIEEVCGVADASGAIDLKTKRIQEVQSSRTGKWEMRQYRLQKSEDGTMLSGRSTSVGDEDGVHEEVRLVERPITQPQGCRWEGLASHGGRMPDGNRFRFWHLVVLYWDPCVGNFDASLSRIECLKEVNDSSETRNDLPEYLNQWLSSFGACRESLSGISVPEGSVSLTCEHIDVKRESSSHWCTFKYDLRLGDNQSELSGTVAEIPAGYVTDEVGHLRLFAESCRVLSLEPVHSRFEIACRSLSGDVMASLKVEGLSESVAQFRARLVWTIPGLPHGRVCFVLPSGRLLDESNSCLPICEAVGLEASTFASEQVLLEAPDTDPGKDKEDCMAFAQMQGAVAGA